MTTELTPPSMATRTPGTEGGPTIVICFDGMAPAYLEQTETPVFDRLGEEGRWLTGRCQFPSVTNVNNVSILTGARPADHGINANFAVGPDGEEVYMESPDMIRVPTFLQRAAEAGQRVAAISSKDKLARIIGEHAHVTFSVERPAEWVVAEIGEPPPIYSYEANLWLLRAAPLVVERERPDVLYVTTTDYLSHMLPPQAPEARTAFAESDRLVGALIEGIPGVSIAITADHGMNAKHRGISPEAVLRQAGIESVSVSTLQDRYVKHHGNMSGSAYVHLPHEAADLGRAREVLAARAGIERVLTRAEAAAEFHLDPERIGALVLLGDEETAFGAGDEPEWTITIRSHGSDYEREVPLITWGPRFEGFDGFENRSIGEWLMAPPPQQRSDEYGQQSSIETEGSAR
ncbi:MAG: alkaline phosphatase family protein [Dehalococcoidia bacterium]|nr:alkaline phosphatase family protein [Dehalococcoidia bacterium]